MDLRVITVGYADLQEDPIPVSLVIEVGRRYQQQYLPNHEFLVTTDLEEIKQHLLAGQDVVVILQNETTISSVARFAKPPLFSTSEQLEQFIKDANIEKLVFIPISV